MSFLDKILFDSYFGDKVLELFDPILREIHPIVPGDIFPAYFLLEYFQRPLIAAVIVAMVAAFLGTFLLIRNLALLGDGIAHVSFGGIAIGLAFGGIGPLWYALVFSTFAAIVIDQLQTRNLISGDASIAIFLTGTLGLGLVILRVYGGAPQSTVDSYLWGSLNLIDRDSFDFVLKISILGYVSLVVLYQMLLSISIDPISARVQGLPVRAVGLYFSIITAAIIVSMVQIVGVLLVTALIVTPAATAQLIGKSFRSCVILSQVIGVITVVLGIYFSAENQTGSGSMIALVSAIVFTVVLLLKLTIGYIVKPKENLN